MKIPSVEERREHLEEAEQLFKAIQIGRRLFSDRELELLQKGLASYAAIITMSLRGEGHDER